MKPQELYPPAYLARAQAHNRIWTALTALVTVGALAACIVLCCRLTTANADRTQLLVCVISAVAGWIVIFLMSRFVLPGRRELAHLRSLQDEPRIRVCGAVTMEPGRVRIPRSITVRRLRVQTEEGAKRVSVNVRGAKSLPPLPATLALYTAHDYVVAWEVAE